MVARRVRSVRFLDEEWRVVIDLAAKMGQKPAEYLREKSLAVANAQLAKSQPKPHNAHHSLSRT